MKDIIALIPARGGSKGIPRKNITLVAGKPLIVWTIEAAQKSRLITRVVVSTDDEEIADISLKAGAEVPFLRPSSLAEDTTPAIPVIIHALDWLAAKDDYHPEYLALLQPTSPLRISNDIDNAILLALKKKADSVIGVTEAESHPYWTRKIHSDGRLAEFIHMPEEISRRQDLPLAYVINGAIYIVQTGLLLEKKTLYTENSFAYTMPRERSMDIDTPFDLLLADLYMSNIHK